MMTQRVDYCPAVPGSVLTGQTKEAPTKEVKEEKYTYAALYQLCQELKVRRCRKTKRCSLQPDLEKKT